MVVHGDFAGDLIGNALMPDISIGQPGVLIEGNLTGRISTARDIEVPITIMGNIEGTLSARGFIAGETSRGDLTVYGYLGLGANIFTTILDGIGTLFRFGGSIGEDGESVIAATTFEYGPDVGQIICGADGVTTLAWEEATVEIGGGELSPVPYYDETGLKGAVGEVPFHLHGLDCNPPDGEDALAYAFTVTLRFYGPVICDEGFPFLIEYTEDSVNWTDDTAHWSVESGYGTRSLTLLYFDSNDPSIIPDDREYRIIPLLTGDGILRCDKLLTEDNVSVGDFEYHFFSHAS